MALFIMEIICLNGNWTTKQYEKIKSNLHVQTYELKFTTIVVDSIFQSLDEFNKYARDFTLQMFGVLLNEYHVGNASMDGQ